MATALPMADSTAAGARRSIGVAQRYYRRFTPLERIMHVALMLTFVGCALTGLPLLYSNQAWATTLSHLLGGFETAGVVHRLCAFVMIVVFVSHVVLVFGKAIARRNVLAILWGPDSLVPQPQDGIDIWRNLKWFVGRGPRPQFDRWTYWEKFDYWAVFWGMFIIGGSGLLLWFPVFFAKLLPGWMFNIASLVHGEEALLAVGLEHELKTERRFEYERLTRESRLAAKEAAPPTHESTLFGWVVGGTALSLGIVAIVLIVYSAF